MEMVISRPSRDSPGPERKAQADVNVQWIVQVQVQV